MNLSLLVASLALQGGIQDFGQGTYRGPSTQMAPGSPNLKHYERAVSIGERASAYAIVDTQSGTVRMHSYSNTVLDEMPEFQFGLLKWKEIKPGASRTRSIRFHPLAIRKGSDALCDKCPLIVSGIDTRSGDGFLVKLGYDQKKEDEDFIGYWTEPEIYRHIPGAVGVRDFIPHPQLRATLAILSDNGSIHYYNLASGEVEQTYDSADFPILNSVERIFFYPPPQYRRKRSTRAAKARKGWRLIGRPGFRIEFDDQDGDGTLDFVTAFSGGALRRLKIEK